MLNTLFTVYPYQRGFFDYLSSSYVHGRHFPCKDSLFFFHRSAKYGCSFLDSFIFIIQLDQGTSLIAAILCFIILTKKLETRKTRTKIYSFSSFASYKFIINTFHFAILYTQVIFTFKYIILT